MFGLLLGRVWMSRVVVTSDKFPPRGKCIVMCSLQIMSFSSRWDHSIAAGGDGSAQSRRNVIYVVGATCGLFGETSLASSWCWHCWRSWNCFCKFINASYRSNSQFVNCVWAYFMCEACNLAMAVLILYSVVGLCNRVCLVTLLRTGKMRSKLRKWKRNKKANGDGKFVVSMFVDNL